MRTAHSRRRPRASSALGTLIVVVGLLGAFCATALAARTSRRLEAALPSTVGPSGEEGAVERHAERHAALRPSRRNGCEISLAGSSPLLTAGEQATLLGAITCPSGTNPGGAAVSVREHGRQGSGPSSISAVGTTTTASDGSFQVTTGALSGNCVFVVRAEGGLATHLLVKVAPLVTLSGPTTGAALATRVGHRLSPTHNRWTFSGTVTPAAAGTRVALQSEYAAGGERWHTVAFAVVGPEGDFSVPHSFRQPGQLSVRALVRPHGESAGVSSALSYEVAQAQNPALTINTSVDPLQFGGSATISGVAVGARGPVELQARSGGNPFAGVASEATGPDGSYSFTVSPTRSTYYRVIDGSTHSTALLEGVKAVLTLDPTPAGAQTGNPITFAGSVSPAVTGEPVYLERATGSGVSFHVIAEGQLGPSGEYSIAHAFAAAGAYSLRIKVPADGQTEGATGAPFPLSLAAAAGQPAEA